MTNHDIEIILDNHAKLLASLKDRVRGLENYSEFLEMQLGITQSRAYLKDEDIKLINRLYELNYQK